MVDHTTIIYFIVDDSLKASGHIDDVRCELSDAEVITAALMAARYFSGNIEHSRATSCNSGSNSIPAISLTPGMLRTLTRSRYSAVCDSERKGLIWHSICCVKNSYCASRLSKLSCRRRVEKRMRLRFST